MPAGEAKDTAAGKPVREMLLEAAGGLPLRALQMPELDDVHDGYFALTNKGVPRAGVHAARDLACRHDQVTVEAAHAQPGGEPV
jgi:hypothetical protein